MDIDILLKEGKKVEARLDGFTLLTDQPLDEGGENKAPSPYSLFLAGLATCCGYYVKQFCDTRDIPTEGIGISQKISYDEKKRHLDRVDLKISLPPEFPAKYDKALVRVVNACSVKKAILNPPEMVVTTSREE